MSICRSGPGGPCGPSSGNRSSVGLPLPPFLPGERDAVSEPVPFALVERACRDEGFVACATIEPPARLPDATVDRLLADGVGDMTWLAETRALRLHPADFFPGARALLVALHPYQRDRENDEVKRARYAAGRDYHGLLRRKMARIGCRLGESAGAGKEAVRAAVDSAPVAERALAHRAGLGWLGRNALLLHPERGSWFFIACCFTTFPLELRRGPHGEDRCGTCRSCEEVCPTGAIEGRRVISERCISYLTIEHRGVIPRDLAAVFRGWWFGCDLCQEVCPWNRFADDPVDGRLRGRDDARALLGVREEEFDERFAGRAIRRIDYPRFRRNLLVALWSLGRLDESRHLVAATDHDLVRAQACELGIGP